MTRRIARLELDGSGCPMAHCNRHDDSLHHLPPLRRAETAQRIIDPVVSPRSFVHLGAYTGERAAVCTYDSPAHPALVAYDFMTGSVLWTSPQEDLPGLFHRWPSGILLAKMSVDGGPAERLVFAANPVEFVAYSADGRRLWKRPASEIDPEAPAGVGMPTSLSFTDAHELVCATTGGWIVKLDPVDGRVIATYQMKTRVIVDGREYRGVFATTKSPVVIGNVLYLLVDFKPNPSVPFLHPFFRPVHLVRIELSQPGVPGAERAIKPLAWPTGLGDATPDRVQIGFHRGTGSPPALVRVGRDSLLFVHSHDFSPSGLQPSITAVEDCGGVLGVRWHSVLNAPPGDDVYAAPALHADSETLFVTTLQSLYLFRRVAGSSGRIPCPVPVPLPELVASAADARVSSVRVGSPLGLAFDPDSEEIVGYTNFRISPEPGFLSYGFLGAFAVSAVKPGAARPLWQRPLGVTRDGVPVPGLGTFGQPALFTYDRGGEEATGVIVNTVCTGTYIFK